MWIFEHRENRNFIGQFVEFYGNRGYDVHLVPGYWPLRLNNSNTGHKIAVREAGNVWLKREIAHLRDDIGADKVIFMDFEDWVIPQLQLWVAAATDYGVGIYSGKHKWVTYPNIREGDSFDRVFLALLPNYEVGEDGITRKRCTGCEKLLPVTEFYKKPTRVKVPRDPYRPKCKKCYR